MIKISYRFLDSTQQLRRVAPPPVIMSKKHFRYRSLAFLIASLHSFSALSAAEIYIGDSAAEGASYEILAIGDPITVTAVETAGTAELINGTFTVNGINPTINLEGNEQIVH